MVPEPEDVRRLLAYVHDLRHPARNSAIILLSYKAGLRACEIAGLTWPMVLTTRGQVDDCLRLAAFIVKGRCHGRTIPMHADLRRALVCLHRESGRPAAGPVIQSERGGAMTARGLVNFFTRTYSDLGLAGCSSHSGRRSFITRSARALSRSGGSLRDIQELAGHRALTTTERYIEGNRDAQRKLISLI
jgi:integrase/recombinase XerD